MHIKDEFNLLAKVPNVLPFSGIMLNKYRIEDGLEKIISLLEINRAILKHDYYKYILESLKTRSIRVIPVNMDSYILPISYNPRSNEIIINFHPLGISDISSVDIDPRNLYALLLYGIVFKNSFKAKLSIEMAAPIVGFFSSILVRFFGKDYGLIGPYIQKLSKLKFLTTFYILSSFYERISLDQKIEKSSSISVYTPTQEEKITLATVDMSNIINYLKVLSDFDVMPGMNRYLFSSKFVRFFGSNFLPALEDVGRFFSILYISSIRGENIIPGFIKKYNMKNYSDIIHYVHKNLVR